jgi:ribosomal protein L28
MSYRKCDRCGRGSVVGRQVTAARQHLNYRSRKVFKINLHPKRVWDVKSKAYQRLRLCVKCIRWYKEKKLTPETRRDIATSA